ncbi:hypothetical protein EVAR_36821_1 [Eumeta japonica]|uniref:Uncharacterized protein n=1 Tax=Eumeta variegata TaxID=151549 RepID=A0A4C1WYN6_EUMVA|nr:hypothetical protein EVAR_36821_1 [Eumeta japonica]
MRHSFKSEAMLNVELSRRRRPRDICLQSWAGDTRAAASHLGSSLIAARAHTAEVVRYRQFPQTRPDSVEVLTVRARPSRDPSSISSAYEVAETPTRVEPAMAPYPPVLFPKAACSVVGLCKSSGSSSVSKTKREREIEKKREKERRKTNEDNKGPQAVEDGITLRR